MEKLGILINSTAHTQAVIQLACAARERGKAVEIFLAGQGVQLVGNTNFSLLSAIGPVRICSASIAALGAGNALPRACRLVPPEELAEFLRSCDRHVVF
jgi:sulfur relay (sulfurtransferase) complex TusBCD TusD component (DsrE family)